jgi:hypothetical protein
MRGQSIEVHICFFIVTLLLDRQDDWFSLVLIEIQVPNPVTGHMGMSRDQNYMRLARPLPPSGVHCTLKWFTICICSVCMQSVCSS